MFLLVFTVEALGLSLSVIRPIVAIAYLTIVPGLLLVTYLEIDHDLVTVVGYVVGLSFIVTMAVGGLASLILPRLGLESPMDPLPLAIEMVSVTTLIAASVWRRDPEFGLEIPFGDFLEPFPLALLLLPFVSLLGTVYMKVTDSNIVLLYLLLGIALLPIGLVWRSETNQWYGLAVWSVSASLLYHGGLWPFTAGHQLSTITVEQGRWAVNYGDGIGTLLPNGVLYPAYAILADIPMSIQFEVVNPLFISLLPVLLYAAFRRQTDERKALVGVCLFMFSFPFYTLYPNGGRVSTPVFFLALTALAVSDEVIPTNVRRVLILAFAAGIAVSHYGTAWVVMGAFFFSGLLLIAVRVADRLWPGRERPVAESEGGGVGATPTADGGHSKQGQALAARTGGAGLLRWSFVAFYTAFAMAWYLYTGLGGKFKTLPNHVIGGLREALYQDELSGTAVRSATKNYGSFSISTARQIYILFGALMAIGIVYIAWKRVVRDERVVDDEFLALGAGFLAILATAFLPVSTGFNTARVMMIVFTFTAPFAVFGADAIVGVPMRLWKRVTDRASDFGEERDSGFGHPSRSGRVVAVGLASLLAVFLLLNTGVVSEVATKGYAPSTSVSQERLSNSEDPIERSKASECLGCRVQTHVWIFDNRGTNVSLYGDDLAGAQVDYYRGEISGEVNGVPSGSSYSSIWEVRNGKHGPAYLVLLPHNLDTDGVFVTGKYDWRALSTATPIFKNSSVIYSTGYNKIYLTKSSYTT